MRSNRLFLALALMGALVAPAVGEESASVAPVPGERPVFAQSGSATYYGGRIVGHPTASGERLAGHGLTAAHRTLPFGTVVRVTNLGNGRVVKVRINDRGPYSVGGLRESWTSQRTPPRRWASPNAASPE